MRSEQGNEDKNPGGVGEFSLSPTQQQADYAAYEAGHKLDRIVAQKVMGMFPCDGWKLSPDGRRGIAKHCNHPNCFPEVARAVGTPASYSTDIRDAMQVVERLAEEHRITLIHFAMPNEAKKWMVSLSTNRPGVIDREAEAETLPLAICRAALMACEVEQ